MVGSKFRRKFRFSPVFLLFFKWLSVYSVVRTYIYKPVYWPIIVWRDRQAFMHSFRHLGYVRLFVLVVEILQFKFLFSYPLFISPLPEVLVNVV